MRGNCVAADEAGVEANIQTAGDMEHFHRAGGLGVDAEFDGTSPEADVLLGKGQRDARRGADLPFDEVDARQHFCDGVLHLQPNVHFHEPEAALLVQKKFQGAHAHIVKRFDGGG